MKRVHLFEFEDQNWFPDLLRNYGTDFLQFLSNKSKLFKPAIPILEKGLKLSKTNHIIDLGSGAVRYRCRFVPSRYSEKLIFQNCYLSVQLTN